MLRGCGGLSGEVRFRRRFGRTLVVVAGGGMRAAVTVVSARADLTPDSVLAADRSWTVVIADLELVGPPVPFRIAFQIGVRIHGRRGNATGNFMVHAREEAQK